MASFLEHLEARAQARRDAPAGSRIGIAPGTEYLARQALREWRDWLVEQGHTSLTTGELDQSLFRSFVLHLGSTDGPRGPRSNASISRICRNLKVLVRWWDGQAPRLVRRCDRLIAGLQPPPLDRSQPRALPPEDLIAFFKAAIAIEQGKPVRVKRQKQGCPQEDFEQRATPADLSIPRLFILLAALGCRLHEAFALKWADVDTRGGGVITIAGGKTGARIILLDDRRQGRVAPELLTLLEAWRSEAPDGWPHVLVTRSGKPPDRKDKRARCMAFPRRSWNRVCEAAGATGITPQVLRQNWVSYAAACGIPPSVAALRAGHSLVVAQRWYISQVKDTHEGESMLAAMGLATELWRFEG